MHVRIGGAGSCGDPNAAAVELPLMEGSQIWVPSSTLPVWNIVSVDPAVVEVRACKALQSTVCRAVRVHPIAERCSDLAPLGIAIFGTKHTPISVPFATIYVAGTLVGCAALLGLQVTRGTPSQQ